MITVIKLGGSLLNAKVLPECLDAVAGCSGNVLIVPGGGVFADQVRAAQQRWGFSDAVAHGMAILAMQQMALLINSLKPEFKLLRSISNLAVLPKVVVWAPDSDELDMAGIPASWDITSDSLAAWLAGQVGAHELVLVKSCTVPESADLAELQRQGVIDAGFLKFAKLSVYNINVVNYEVFLSRYAQIY